MTEWFDASWEDQNLSDDDLMLLQYELLQDPAYGDVMRGTGGFRKIRFALPGHGKSGGMRVIYLDIPIAGILYLLLVYPKNEKETLSRTECNELKQISANIKKNHQARKRKGNNHV